MVYADYAYYVADFAGTALTEDEFPSYAKKASALVDYVTFGRIEALGPERVIDAVRDATCAVAEKLKQFDSARVTDSDGRALASENNDGYSVSFRDGDSLEAQTVQTKTVLTTIRMYLAHTGLMYQGIYPKFDLPETV